MSIFYYFNFEMNYNILKSKSPSFLLNKNINYDKDETGSGKMENKKFHTHFHRNELYASAHVRIAN